MEEFWQRATQISASGEPAVLATVIAVHRQVPKASPPGTCLIVTPAGAIGAESPSEIAVAVLAQFIQVGHSRTDSASDWALPRTQAVGLGQPS